MRLVTYRKGPSRPKIGAATPGAVLDLGALAVDLARERGAVRHGRGGFPKCISVLSEGFTLLPGDVIATGTPAGVGAALGEFLRVGDTLEAEVERIGVLQNHVVAP